MCFWCVMLMCVCMHPSTEMFSASFIRCGGGRSVRRGGVQVIRRWHRASADRRRGADSEPSVCVWRWFHPGAPRHPLPKTGHAGSAAHRGQSFACQMWIALTTRALIMWMCFFTLKVSQQTAKCIPALVCPELTEQIRREVAAALHRRKGEFPCYFFTDLVTFTLPAGSHLLLFRVCLWCTLHTFLFQKSTLPLYVPPQK